MVDGRTSFWLLSHYKTKSKMSLDWILCKPGICPQERDCKMRRDPLSTQSALVFCLELSNFMSRNSLGKDLERNCNILRPGCDVSLNPAAFLSCRAFSGFPSFQRANLEYQVITISSSGRIERPLYEWICCVCWEWAIDYWKKELCYLAVMWEYREKLSVHPFSAVD